MKKWKSFLSAFIAGIMILSCATGLLAANVTFTDVSGHWAWTGGQISYLVSKNVLNGYKQANGTYTFMPDDTVTRAEFIKMLDETFGLTATTSINYTDVKTGDWFYPYFAKAAAQGYLLNYGKNVSPNGDLTREEAITLLVRYLDLLGAEKVPTTTFTDYNRISANFRDAVLVAAKAELINGYLENNGTYTFRPQNTLTRAEALTILYRAAGAIYNTSAYTKDSGAPSTNAVITKGGVTLSNMSLSGRVIVTEGASGDPVTLTGCTVVDTLYIRGNVNVLLDNCTIKNVVLDSKDTDLRISLSSGTTVENMILDSTAVLTLASGTKVTNMTVNPTAPRVSITGNGAIENVSIFATGFISTMLPAHYEIADDIYASFGSQSYTGSSDAVPAFASIPYMTEENGNYYLNVSPDYTGRIYYYFTNMDYAPSSVEFNDAYTNANNKGSFYVNAHKNYVEKTVSSNIADDYDNVIVMLSSQEKDYLPVVIENAPTSGNGFIEAPYFDGTGISFKPEVSGELLYFYTNVSEPFSVSEFQKGYENTDSAMREVMDVTAAKTDYIDLTERYLENYPYLVIVLRNKNGQYYQPVLVSAGDNGFDEEPSISTLGKIEYKTSVSGTMYYYYTSDDTIPTPDEYNALWKGAQRSNLAFSTSVTKNRDGYITYDTAKADRYPYMVFCIKDNNNNYMTPVILKIDIDTGFSVDPYVSSDDQISFRGEHVGTVYWFFSRYDTLPAMGNFLSEWNSASSARRGSVTCRNTSNYFTIEFDPIYTESYPYIAIMMVDSNDNLYQPVMVDVKNTTDSGFSSGPSCNAASELVYFKTNEAGMVYYYFTPANSAYNETPREFWDSYDDSPSRLCGYVSVTAGVLGYIDFNGIDTDDYPGIVLMFTDEDNNDHYPVYVSLMKGESSFEEDKGITVKKVDKDSVTIATSVAGTVYYMFSDDATTPSATKIRTYSDGSRSMEANETLRIPVYEDYDFLYIYMYGYDVVGVVLSEDYISQDGSTLSGTGLSYYDLEYTNDGTPVFLCIPSVNGTLTVSISGFTNSTETYTAKKGEMSSIELNVNLDSILSGPLSGLITFTLNVQLVDADGDIYEKVSIPLN